MSYVRARRARRGLGQFLTRAALPTGTEVETTYATTGYVSSPTSALRSTVEAEPTVYRQPSGPTPTRIMGTTMEGGTLVQSGVTAVVEPAVTEAPTGDAAAAFESLMSGRSPTIDPFRADVRTTPGPNSGVTDATGVVSDAQSSGEPRVGGSFEHECLRAGGVWTDGRCIAGPAVTPNGARPSWLPRLATWQWIGIGVAVIGGIVLLTGRRRRR